MNKRLNKITSTSRAKKNITLSRFSQLLPIVIAIAILSTTLYFLMKVDAKQFYTCPSTPLLGFEFDQESLISTLEHQLDSLQNVFSWGILIFTGMAWAAATSKEDLDIPNFKIPRKYLFIFSVTVYGLFISSIAVFLIRIGDLFCQFKPDYIGKAFTIVTTHSWLLNPLSFWGNSQFSALHSSVGIGLFFFFICFAFTSLLLFEELQGTPIKVAVVFSLVAITAASILIPLFRITELMVQTGITTIPELTYSFAITLHTRFIAILIGFACSLPYVLSVDSIAKKIRSSKAENPIQ